MMVDTKVKKRKVSKKTKKSWRKHIDNKDVDSFLENQRLEERLGVPLSEHADDQLFTIEKVANATKNVLNSKHMIRLTLKNREARCFASLKSHTQVPDPISKRNRVKTKDERMNCILPQYKVERKLKGILKLKEKQALKNKSLAKDISENSLKRGEFISDIWDTKNNPLPETVSQWMSSDSLRHTIKHLGVKKKKLPLSLYKKPSVLPAIEIPHPGTSYNPSYTDHQELLHEVAQKELDFMKQEAHLNRVTKQMFKKIPLNEKDEYLMKEMSEGLPIKNSSNSKISKECDEEEDSSIIIAQKKPKNSKKTLVQKRKQREQKKIVTERALVKLEKKKVSDVYKLKVLQKQIDIKKRKDEIRRQKRMQKHEKKSALPKSLSKTKFEPLDPYFKLTEELTGNLRNCDPIKSLLKDRYKSLQQRNIVAPAVIKLKRDKAKLKRFTKMDHKINLADS